MEECLSLINSGNKLNGLEKKYDKSLIKKSGLLSIKPRIIVCNVDEKSLPNGNKYSDACKKKFPEENGSPRTPRAKVTKRTVHVRTEDNSSPEKVSINGTKSKLFAVTDTHKQLPSRAPSSEQTVPSAALSGLLQCVGESSQSLSTSPKKIYTFDNIRPSWISNNI